MKNITKMRFILLLVGFTLCYLFYTLKQGVFSIKMEQIEKDSISLKIKILPNAGLNCFDKQTIEIPLDDSSLVINNFTYLQKIDNDRLIIQDFWRNVRDFRDETNVFPRTVGCTYPEMKLPDSIEVPLVPNWVKGYVMYSTKQCKINESDTLIININKPHKNFFKVNPNNQIIRLIYLVKKENDSFDVFYSNWLYL